MGSELVALLIWLAGMPLLWLATLDDNGTMPFVSLKRFAALVLLWPLFGFVLWAMAGADLCRLIAKLWRRASPEGGHGG